MSGRAYPDGEVPRLRLAGRRAPGGPPRRPRVLPGVVALVAVGVLLVSVSAARNSQSSPPRARGPRGSIPSAGARLPYGAAVTGSCRTVDRSVNNEMRGWGVYTFDPARISMIGSAGRTLLPTSFRASASPPGLDRFASSSTRPHDLTQWQVAGAGRQMPISPAASCGNSIAVASPDAVVSGTTIALRRPGPYVYWTFDHTVHWVRIDDGTPDPAPRACAQDPDQAGRSPAPVGSPPSAGGGGRHWAVASFCTTVRWRSFYVLGLPGRCSASRSEQDYVNQYTAGARLDLPVARGQLGGNACGPSSLLMAMLQSRRSGGGAASTSLASLPPLQAVFDETMRVPRAQVTSRTIDDFIGYKAAEFLRRHGWEQATLARLGTDADNIAGEDAGSQLDSALTRGPIVLSTVLGTGRWGTTGGGHMIVVTGHARSNPNEYVVYDPAGNYFSDPIEHYGPGSCGSAVLYPRSWLLAYATGEWYLELRSPTPA